MCNATPNELVEELALALETLAFVSVEPTDERNEPSRPVLCAISFSGAFSGELRMIAPAALGELIAANMLGADVAMEQSLERELDSLREIMNVTCGALCSRFAPKDLIELGLPQSRPLESGSDWNAALAKPQTSVLQAEGHTLAIWMEASA